MIKIVNIIKTSIQMKVIVHPKMVVVINWCSSCFSKTVWVSFFCWTEKEDILKNVVTRQLMETIGFHTI